MSFDSPELESRDRHPRSTTEWGILGRSVFWVSQSWIVSALCVIVLLQQENVFVNLVAGFVASVLVVALLFRQIEGLIEQKRDREE